MQPNKYGIVYADGAPSGAIEGATSYVDETTDSLYVWRTDTSVWELRFVAGVQVKPDGSPIDYALF